MAPPETDCTHWLARAKADLRVAELTLSAPDIPSWPAGFHLQQAAEKLLKAVLVCHGRQPPRTHDLALLADEAEALEPTLLGWGDRLLALNDFSVAQRYPGVVQPEVDLTGLVPEVADFVAVVERICAAAP